MPASIKIIRLSTDTVGERNYWLAIRELCCLTGNNGAPIPSIRWPLFGKLWIEPYERLIPDWTFAATADGKVIGYLTGCPQSSKFRWRRLIRCRVPLMGDLLLGRYLTDRSLFGFALRSLVAEQNIRHSFPAEARSLIDNSLPAHLHINVDAPFRGVGVGQKLMAAFLAGLRDQSLPGVHLYCAPAPLQFYRRMGFHELGSVSFIGAQVYALGMSLRKLNT